MLIFSGGLLSGSLLNGPFIYYVLEHIFGLFVVKSLLTVQTKVQPFACSKNVATQSFERWKTEPKRLVKHDL